MHCLFLTFKKCVFVIEVSLDSMRLFNNLVLHSHARTETRACIYVPCERAHGCGTPYKALYTTLTVTINVSFWLMPKQCSEVGLKENWFLRERAVNFVSF